MTKKTNQGFVTEESHYEKLTNCGLFAYVSDPKKSGGGSDFIAVTHEGRTATFESKTSIGDIYDAGVLNVFANGFVVGASSFLTNNHIQQISGDLYSNKDRLAEYCIAANTTMIPHTIHKNDYNAIKSAGKLVQIVGKPLQNIVEHTFTKSNNNFIKANYIVIDDKVYLSTTHPELDPLGLRARGAPVLDDSCVQYTTIRSARGGSRSDGRATVTIRVQYRLHSTIPVSPVTWENISR